MTGETESLILELLHALHSDSATIRDDAREIKTRLGRLEIDAANAHVERAEDRARYDRLAERVARIERRLEPRERPQPKTAGEFGVSSDYVQ